MGQFVGIYTLPRLNHEEIENMNRPKTSNESESVIKSLPSKKSPGPGGPGPGGFIIEYYQTFTELIIPILIAIPKNKRGRNSSKHILYG
jgi:hypothetical protein